METISSIADKEIKSVVIDETLEVDADGSQTSASKTAEIVEAVPGKKIVVVSIVAYRVLFTFTSISFETQWKSGTTAITGKMTHNNTTPALTVMPIPEGHFRTAAGEALNLTLTDTRTGSVGMASALVDGVLTYYEE